PARDRGRHLPAVGIAPGAPARAPRAAAAAVPTVATVAAVPTVAPRRAVAVAAGADRRELLGRLAGHLGIVGQTQADPPALAVDLDHAHAHLVAAVEDLLHRRDPLAGRDVGDV